MATDTESVELRRIQQMFTETPQVTPSVNTGIESNPPPPFPTSPLLPSPPPLPETQVLNSQAHSQPGATQPLIPPPDSTDPAHGNGRLNFPLYYLQTQLYQGETQKDPDTSVDGNSQSQDRPSANSSNPFAAAVTSTATATAAAARPRSAGLEDALVAEIDEPEDEETTTYYDESRRFGSPQVQRDEFVTPRAPRPFGLPGSKMGGGGGTPLGLTQLFNNTQASPLRPNTASPGGFGGFGGFETPFDGLTPRKSPLKKHVLPNEIEPVGQNVEESSSPIRETRKALGRKLARSGNISQAEMEEGKSDIGRAKEKETGKALEEDIGEAPPPLPSKKVDKKAAKLQKENDKKVDAILESLKSEKEKRIAAAAAATAGGNEKGKGKAKKSSKRQSLSKSLSDQPEEKEKRAVSAAEKKKSRSVDERRVGRREKSEFLQQQLSSADGSTTDEEEPTPKPKAKSKKQNVPENRAISEADANAVPSSPPSAPLPPLLQKLEQPPQQPASKPGILDWDSIHDIPKPLSRKLNRSFLRKRSSTTNPADFTGGSKSDTTTSSKDDGSDSPALPPPNPVKPSIRNMPPFNIPPPEKPPSLLHRSSTFSTITTSSLYKGSSSIPMPPSRSDDSFPPAPDTSSPAPLPTIHRTNSKQKESTSGGSSGGSQSTPKPLKPASIGSRKKDRKGHRSVGDEENQELKTPNLDKRLSMFRRKNASSDTSPSSRMNTVESTPTKQVQVHASSSMPLAGSGGDIANVHVQAADTPMQGTGKRKRKNTTNNPTNKKATDEEFSSSENSIVPCSLPGSGEPERERAEIIAARQASSNPEDLLDAEGDTQMDNVDSLESEEVPISETDIDSHHSRDSHASHSRKRTSESPRKKRKRKANSDPIATMNAHAFSQNSTKENIDLATKQAELGAQKSIQNLKRAGVDAFREVRPQSDNSSKPKSASKSKKGANPHTPTPIVTTPAHTNTSRSLSAHREPTAASGPITPRYNPEIDPHSRVFALFRDPKMYYYPATLQPSTNVPKTHARIVFDDGTAAVIERHHITRLDLRMGDVIKCDMPSMKSKLWVVAGFPDDAESTQEHAVDIHGNAVVRLKLKQKGPIGAGGSGSVATTLIVEKEGMEDTYEVPISRIYLLRSLWGQFSNRGAEELTALLDGVSLGGEGGAGGRGSFTPLDTPTGLGRERRPTPLFASMTTTPIPATGHVGKKGMSASVRMSMSSHGGGNASMIGMVGGGSGMLFAGMVFAISFGDNEAEKRSVLAKIVGNGGTVLEHDFEELFEPVDGKKGKAGGCSATTTIAATSDSEGGSRAAERNDGGTVGLRPKPEARQYGFACVIADKCSRRVKFLQALALGIPCLASRWVEDCVRKQTIIDDWDMYLLPAGESSFLSGAIRSRVMPSIFPASTTAFTEILDMRKKMLSGLKVLLVLPKGKQGEKRRPYWFLTAALGASEIMRVGSLEEAVGLLEDGGRGRWDLVYVDGSASGGGGGSRGRGRERMSMGGGGVGGGGTLSLQQQQIFGVRVVDDEWIVQSLILGRLVEE